MVYVEVRLSRYFAHIVPVTAQHRQPPAAHRTQPADVVVTVEGLDASGCGLVRIDGHTLLVDGVHVGERVLVRRRRGRRWRNRAELVKVLVAAQDRAEPACAHFGTCGGCALQHMSSRAQLAFKQQRLVRTLVEHGDVTPEVLLEPLTGDSTGYRRRARLGVKYVPGKGALAGFREKNTAKLAELTACAVLEARVGDAIGDLRRVLDTLEVRHRIPQLEVAMGDSETALVLRHLQPLSTRDRARLLDFVRARDWQLYLQPGGPESIEPLWPEEPAPLCYALPDFDLELEFLPTDFIQINAAMNRALVGAAVQHLDIRPTSRVVDLYCGIGNFTLAAARRAAGVLGVEGDARLISRARANAHRNRIDNAEFVSADLSSFDVFQGSWNGGWDRLILDPPRTGAERVVNNLNGQLPERIVYVSCNPETLARDARVLVHKHGYRLDRAGVVDMFPHTTHCEAMAVFVRSGGPVAP